MTVGEDNQQKMKIVSNNYFKNIVFLYPKYVKHQFELFLYMFNKEFWLTILQGLYPLIGLLLSPILIFIVPINSKKDALKSRLVSGILTVPSFPGEHDP